MQKWEYKIESFGISIKSEEASKVDTYITFERAKAFIGSDITQKKEQLLSENGLEVLCNK